MANARRNYSKSEEVALAAQVDSQCPLCGDPLFYTKGSRTFKLFELAHIYPLNPTPAEAHELDCVGRLHADVNHPDNLIPLCRPCHTKFDKPRTVAEYELLAEIKRSALRKAQQQVLQQTYPLEAELSQIIADLYSEDAESSADVVLDPKSLQEKLDDTITTPTKRKIRHAVQDYYPFVKGRFLALERDVPDSSQLIYSQVKTFYLQQKKLGLSQQDIFINVVAWIRTKTKPASIEAAEILASFFVQNCEVFE